jgi:hypothetical protein
MVGVMNVVSGGAVPETVILKRFTHKRYRKDAVTLISAAATELAALNRALASTDTVSDKECRTCSSSKQQVISAMKLRLLDNPRIYMSGGVATQDELRLAHSASSCPRSRACIEAGFSASTILGGRD